MSSLFQIVPNIQIQSIDYKVDRSHSWLPCLDRSHDYKVDGNDQIALDVFLGLIRVF
jgi:hypothetical protein